MKLTKLGKIMLPFVLLIAVGYTYLITSGFKPHKCEHIYVEEEKELIKQEDWRWSSGTTVPAYGPYGLNWTQDELEFGKELVCIKCYYKTRQIVHTVRLQQIIISDSLFIRADSRQKGAIRK